MAGVEPVGQVVITAALIARRNLSFPAGKEPPVVSPQTLAGLRTIRLDREGIDSIKNLEGLRSVHSLYLQQNRIQRIENLACLPSLRFLSLAGNQIRKVENLGGLPHLQLLDLAQNQIATLEPGELPPTLLILNLSGNACTKQPGYRDRLSRALPQLLDLDGQPLAKREARREEDKATSGVDKEFPELSGLFCAEIGFEELRQELAGRGQQRAREAASHHVALMATPPAPLDLSQLPGGPQAQSRDPRWRRGTPRASPASPNLQGAPRKSHLPDPKAPGRPGPAAERGRK
ncbi:leucine-rich repeat-containing protein 46 isoform X2 [Tachyglossus aculeatus]|uniref:leucine-rich repeat-containing protein 46 isoform X2 n=1 Tax=Tachyglossus aculeatus TaxID=9261 RepID=UPI0018F7B3ED|nr:leucine-rich repeat-containing protein 46 isoform X2 [Tachyglossus aculeatus]